MDIEIYRYRVRYCRNESSLVGIYSHCRELFWILREIERLQIREVVLWYCELSQFDECKHMRDFAVIAVIAVWASYFEFAANQSLSDREITYL